MKHIRSSQEKSSKLPLYIKELRAPFLLATTLPMVLGALLASKGRDGSALLFIVVVVCGALINLATNTLNDYFDYKKGCDNLETPKTPFSGGSGLLVEGLLLPGEVLRLSLFLMFAVITTGTVILFLSPADQFVISLLGLGGLFLGLAYSAPPFSFAARGLGEVAVFLACGPLSVMGPYYIMGGTFSLTPLMASLPPGLMTTAILWINQFPDFETDKKAGKINLLVRMGKREGRLVYYLLIFMALAFLLVGALGGFLPVASLWGLLFLLPLVPAGRIFYKNYDDPARLVPAMALTIVSQVILSVALIVTQLF